MLNAPENISTKFKGFGNKQSRLCLPLSGTFVADTLCMDPMLVNARAAAGVLHCRALLDFLLVNVSAT